MPAIDRLLSAIRAVVGDRGLLTDPADTAAYSEDWRRLYQGRTPAVVRPADDRRNSPRWCGSAPRPACRSCRRAATPPWSAAPCRPKTAANWCSAPRG